MAPARPLPGLYAVIQTLISGVGVWRASCAHIEILIAGGLACNPRSHAVRVAHPVGWFERDRRSCASIEVLSSPPSQHAAFWRDKTAPKAVFLRGWLCTNRRISARTDSMFSTASSRTTHSVTWCHGVRPG